MIELKVIVFQLGVEKIFYEISRKWLNILSHFVLINNRICNKLLIFNLFRYNIDITTDTIKLFAAL